MPYRVIQISKPVTEDASTPCFIPIGDEFLTKDKAREYLKGMDLPDGVNVTIIKTYTPYKLEFEYPD